MATESPRTPGLWPMPQAAQAATEYLLDAWQRTILTWDVLRERGNQYLEHEKSGNPPVLVFDYETVVDGRELAEARELRAGAHQAARRLSDCGSEEAAVRGDRSARGPRPRDRRVQDRQRDRDRAQGRPPVLLRDVLSAAGAGPDDRVRLLRRSAVPAQGQRAAPGGRGQAVRHRQLPGRLGADDARRARAEARRADPARRLADLLLGGRRRQEPDALLGRPARRHLDGLARGRPRPRQVRRRLPRQQLREPEPVEHLLDQALQPVREGRHRARALPRVREVVGRPLPHEQGGDGVDLAEPLRRQQALRRRGRVVRRQASRRHPQHPLADRRVRLVGRQHHPAAAGARLDPRPLSQRRGDPR